MHSERGRPEICCYHISYKFSNFQLFSNTLHRIFQSQYPGSICFPQHSSTLYHLSLLFRYSPKFGYERNNLQATILEKW